VRELERPQEGRLLAGVCAGLASGLVIEVTLLRLAFLLLALASGIGVLLYLALWILLPREDVAQRSGLYRDVIRANLSAMGKDVRLTASAARAAWARVDETESRRHGWPRPLSRRWIAIGLIGGGLLIFLYSLGVFAWLGFGRTLGLALAALGGAVLFSRTVDLRRR
jgi:phage shock protein PspC (stress-responsive transcriptional regulator)